MKGKILLFATVIAAMAMLFVSCRTLPVGEAEVSATVEIEVEIVHNQSEPAETQPSVQPAPDPVPAPQPEPAPAPEPVPEETPGEQVPGDVPGSEPSPTPAPVPQPVPGPVIEEKIGKTGPHGGIIFKGENGYLETGIPVETVSSYIEALLYCANLNPDNPTEYRIPYIGELSAIYSQLIETGLYDPGVEYAWSSSEDIFDNTQKAMNLETGFTGSFYTDSTFVGVIPVTEMAN